MEHQGQHGHAGDRVDEHGNPVAGHDATGGMGMGAASAYGAFTGTGDGQFQPVAGREEHKARGALHHSGSSSSSSSSEDDGMGGRRKKGMKEIKEKLPGAHKDDQQGVGPGGAYRQQGHTGMTGGTGAHGVDTGEKRGLMDKIKEKLPGQH